VSFEDVPGDFYCKKGSLVARRLTTNYGFISRLPNKLMCCSQGFLMLVGKKVEVGRGSSPSKVLPHYTAAFHLPSVASD